MGMNATAHLVYGIDLGTEDVPARGANHIFDDDSDPGENHPEQRVDVEMYGADGCLGYILHPEESSFEHEWGYDPQDVDLKKMVVAEDADERLRDVCEKLKIPFVEPRWLLVARYF